MSLYHNLFFFGTCNKRLEDWEGELCPLKSGVSCDRVQYPKRCVHTWRVVSSILCGSCEHGTETQERSERGDVICSLNSFVTMECLVCRSMIARASDVSCSLYPERSAPTRPSFYKVEPPASLLFIFQHKTKPHYAKHPWVK